MRVKSAADISRGAGAILVGGVRGDGWKRPVAFRKRWTKYRSCREDSCLIRQRTVASIATDALYQYRRHPLTRLLEEQHIPHVAARLAASLPEPTAVLPSSLCRHPQET